MSLRLALVVSLCVGLLACDEPDIVARRSFAACLDRQACETASPDVCEAPTVCNADSLECGAAIAPAVRVGDSCTMRQPVLSFRHALCSCGDFVSTHDLIVEHTPPSNSMTEGMADDVAAPRGAPVAVDGNLTTTAGIRVEGGLVVSGNLELPDGGLPEADPVSAQTGRSDCDCSATSNLSIEDADALVPAQSPAGFDPAQLQDVTSNATVTLTCGSYRVARIAGTADLHLAISGHVVLLVEGDLALEAGMEVSVEQGGLFELIVLGNVGLAGPWLLQGDPGQTRVYALGNGTIDLSAEALISGPLYAPRAELVTRGDITVLGAVFVRRAAPGGTVLIRYDSTSAVPSACDD